MKKQFQIGLISLNGINAYIQWKAWVSREIMFDDNGNEYTHVHQATKYIDKVFGSMQPVKWDQENINSI